MQLTQFTDYSLRVLIYLARLPEPGISTVPEIAQHFPISRHHLVKVVQKLALNGFVLTSRGKGGGIQLSRPPEAIGMGEVIRVTEPNMNLVECFDPKTNQCRIIKDCYLKAILFESRMAFLAVLDRFSLADAAESKTANG
jgi:Rrf2 family nitric oxide-sensitive transcriptional repressor